MFIEGTSPNDNDASKTPAPVSRDELRSLIKNQVNETLKRTLPDILKSALRIAKKLNVSEEDEVLEQPQPKRAKLLGVDSDLPTANVSSSRSEKYYSTAQEATISKELTSFLKSAFTKQLSKEVLTNVIDQYPDIKGTVDFLVSPTM